MSVSTSSAASQGVDFSFLVRGGRARTGKGARHPRGEGGRTREANLPKPVRDGEPYRPKFFRNCLPLSVASAAQVVQLSGKLSGFAKTGIPPPDIRIGPRHRNVVSVRARVDQECIPPPFLTASARWLLYSSQDCTPRKNGVPWGAWSRDTCDLLLTMVTGVRGDVGGDRICVHTGGAVRSNVR